MLVYRPGSGRYPATAWAQAQQSVALVIPSAVIPQEQNYILNPGHSEPSGTSGGIAEAVDNGKMLHE